MIIANGGNGAFGSGGGGGRVAIYYEDAAGFDLLKVTAFGGAGDGGFPNGGVGTFHLEQTFAMQTPSDSETPVMTAERERDERVTSRIFNDSYVELGQQLISRKDGLRILPLLSVTGCSCWAAP